ncbi:MAG TPA: penicillin-binding protein 2 [Solirubrobacteraceae bacterium]|nr:penicillin-binding protein 2 [Solirubrobacteraceae bacterium]
MSMIERVRPAQPRVPVSPQLALRVAVLGAAALVMFGIIFFRLWYLQVLSGDQYVQQANANRVRDLPIPAPRGEIVDRSGHRIVTTRTTNAVQIIPSALPSGHSRTLLYRRLGRLLDMHPGRIQALVKGHQPPYANVTIKTDAGPTALSVLAERQNDFPGVTQQPVSIRDYPLGEMAAQMFGYVGQIDAQQLKRNGFRGVKQGTVVGKDGVEFYYDRYLRGTPGIQRVEVNSLGQTEPTRIAPTQPKSGYDLKLSIDLGLEREGWAALRQGIGLANSNGNPADAAAFVALDPRNGQVLAMGSYPSFDPNKLARPITPAEYARVTGRSGGGAPAPLTNRAVSGTYPTGSTFKPITAMGALQAGIISPGTALGAGQCITVSSQQFCNAGKANFGALDLANALRVSSDTYFFQVGELANSHGSAIQRMARQLGIGERTDVDLPSEITGIVPDRAWRASVAAKELSCERRTHRTSCGISDGRPWSVGDNMHLAVGQGDLIASPLQLAVAYSTLANAYSNAGRGTVVRPHLGMEVDDSQGGLVRTLGAPPARHVSLNYSDLQVVMGGLHAAASQPGGTSQDVWTGWNQARYPVYGKTGTAQHTGQSDQAWYMCYLPDAKRPIVIAVTIERGGFGDESAAPVARLMASEWFHQPKKFVAGTSKTL